jgi:predicted dithiol-disulfide oxidoreductase (DUF899 family)
VTDHRVVSSEEWLRARTELLATEKEFTRIRDDLAQQRRDLPWERVLKSYQFEGPEGRESLSDLFAGASQLIVYHFMFEPSWDEGCPHCSFWADQFDGIAIHLAQRDATLVAISRAPFSKLDAYRKRMGWKFKWVSSSGTDFNFDYHVSFTPDEQARGEAFYNFKTQDPGMPDREGVSVFYRDSEGSVFHTYSAYARGIDMLNAAYHYIDLTPKGRDEAGHENPQFWVRRHDEYTLSDR